MPWLTYAQAGGRLGVSAEAVRAVAKRRRWPRRRSNTDPHGAVEVEVPDDARITPKPAARPVTDRSPPGRLDLAAGALAALETAVMSLTARAERAEAASLATEARALAAEVALTGERTRSDDLRTRLDALTARLAEAQAAAEALRAAEVERQGRPEHTKRPDLTDKPAKLERVGEILQAGQRVAPFRRWRCGLVSVTGII